MQLILFPTSLFLNSTTSLYFQSNLKSFVSWTVDEILSPSHEYFRSAVIISLWCWSSGQVWAQSPKFNVTMSESPLWSKEEQTVVWEPDCRSTLLWVWEKIEPVKLVWCVQWWEKCLWLRQVGLYLNTHTHTHTAVNNLRCWLIQYQWIGCNSVLKVHTVRHSLVSEYVKISRLAAVIFVWLIIILHA